MNLFREYWEYVAVFFGGVLSSAAAISWFYYFISWKAKNRKEQKDPSVSYYYGEPSGAGMEEQRKLQSQIQELKKKLAEKKRQLSEKTEENEELKKSLSEKASGRTVELDVENDTISRYFSVPSKNGTFPAEKGVKKENDNTWYRIEYKRNEQTGKLFYLQGKADKRALNQMDLFLKPVCEFENSDVAGPQKIQLVYPGKVTLKDGNWIIDKKLKLRLS